MTPKGRIMGWCSGTYLFDDICSVLLSDKSKEEVLKQIIYEFESMDWDCQQDSQYYDHPLIQKIFREIHPNWFIDSD